jgi:hypothetical protein
MAREVQRMPTAIRDTLVGTTLLGLICIAGCGPQKAAEYGVASSEISSTTSAAEPIPGIDEFSVTFVTLKAGPPDGLPFVVWSDLIGGSSGHGEGGVRGATYEGHHQASNGRRVDFHAKTSDGQAGCMTIAGVDYDLAKGSLFLVSGRQGPPKVAQISFDSTGFPKVGGLRSDALRELANSKAEIRAFFEKQKKGDSNPKSGDP